MSDVVSITHRPHPLTSEKIGTSPRPRSGLGQKVALFFAVGLIGAALVVAQAPAFKVIAHPSVTDQTLTNKTISRIFLRQVKRLPSGEYAKPIDQPLDSEIRKSFNRDVLGKSAAETESFWDSQVFSGRSSPPPTGSSDNEILDYVRSTPGAIGYVSASASISGVKTLTVVD